MGSKEAAEILRGMEAFVNPDGIQSPFVEALEVGAEALELLEWAEEVGVKIESRRGVSKSFDPWLVNAGDCKFDAVTGRTLLSTLRAARKASKK